MTGDAASEGTARISVSESSDVVMARKSARAIAQRQGLGKGDVEALATAVSEVGANIVVHATIGEIALGPIEERGRRGVLVVARDHGPGIADVEQALEDGFSTGGGLGLGLSGARRLVDEFEIVSVVERGTTVIMKKWAR